MHQIEWYNVKHIVLSYILWCKLFIYFFLLSKIFLFSLYLNLCIFGRHVHETCRFLTFTILYASSILHSPKHIHPNTLWLHHSDLEWSVYALPLVRFLLLAPPAWMTSLLLCLFEEHHFFGLNGSVLGSINSNCGVTFATRFVCNRTTCPNS